MKVYYFLLLWVYVLFLSGRKDQLAIHTVLLSSCTHSQRTWVSVQSTMHYITSQATDVCFASSCSAVYVAFIFFFIFSFCRLSVCNVVWFARWIVQQQRKFCERIWKSHGVREGNAYKSYLYALHCRRLFSYISVWLLCVWLPQWSMCVLCADRVIACVVRWPPMFGMKWTPEAILMIDRPRRRNKSE